MSFRFFRPWEDTDAVNTGQTPAPPPGASVAPDETNISSHMYSGPSDQRDQCILSSDNANIIPQIASGSHGAFPEETVAAKATEKNVSSQNPKASLNTTYSMSVQDSSLSTVEARNLTCASESADDTYNQGMDCDYEINKTPDQSLPDCNTVRKSSNCKDQGSSESQKTFSSITSKEGTFTAVFQNGLIPKVTFTVECATPSNTVTVFDDSLPSDNASVPSVFRATTTLDVDVPVDGRENTLTKASREELKDSSAPSKHKKAQSESLQGTVFAPSRSRHLRLHKLTNKESKLFICTVCEKAFSHASDLRRHERIHTGSKPFKCTVCEKAFSQSSHLRTHERTHTGSTPFPCRFCVKAFSQSRHLHQHERTHTGSKPFPCTVCEKGFSQSSTLRKHERTHTGSKPLKCTVCEKAFSQSSDLHRHERTHTGSMPFKCTVCEKAFSRSSTLRTHERTHTGSKPVKCTVCEKTFSDSSNLRKHERTHVG